MKIFSDNALGPGENDVILDGGYMGDSCICAPDDAHNREYKHAIRILRAGY